MILEKETFKAFGYYPSELTHGSHKPILAACDDCGKVRLTTKNAYHPLCSSCSKKGKKATDEARANMSAAHKGRTVTEETKALISASLKGGIFTEEHKANISAGAKGKKCKPFTKEHKANISAAGKCKIFTEEHRANMSAAKKGKKATDEARAHMSVAKKGEKHPNWKGGISFEPYCEKFDDDFKRKIRNLFGNECFLCSKSAKENGQALDVHHPDYNKQCGCDGTKCSCVPLCKSCHMKTNHNRAYWQALILEMLKPSEAWM